MYCIKCGVKLEDTEKVCPLCNTTVYHPEIDIKFAEPTYPEKDAPTGKVSVGGRQSILTILFFIPLYVCILCDIKISGGIVWSGYVAGGIVISYVSFVLPFWFKNPNPVIFVPVSFASIGLFLMYVNYATQGNWVYIFGLPVVGYICGVITALIALVRYIKRGRLYMYGGAAIALGGLMPIAELLLDIVVGKDFGGWSFYPLMAFAIIGIVLIFLAIYRPAREVLERKFFI